MAPGRGLTAHKPVLSAAMADTEVGDGGLTAPLLTSASGRGRRHAHVSLEEGAGKPNFWPCTLNLTKVILGAGIMVSGRGGRHKGGGVYNTTEKRNKPADYRTHLAHSVPGARGRGVRDGG